MGDGGLPKQMHIQGGKRVKLVTGGLSIGVHQTKTQNKTKQKDHRDQKENKGVSGTKRVRTGQKPDDLKNLLDPDKGEEQVDEGKTLKRQSSMRANCDLFLDPWVENTSIGMDPDMDPHGNNEIREMLPEISEVDVLESMLTHMHYNLILILTKMKKVKISKGVWIH